MWTHLDTLWLTPVLLDIGSHSLSFIYAHWYKHNWLPYIRSVMQIESAEVLMHESHAHSQHVHYRNRRTGAWMTRIIKNFILRASDHPVTHAWGEMHTQTHTCFFSVKEYALHVSEVNQLKLNEIFHYPLWWVRPGGNMKIFYSIPSYLSKLYSDSLISIFTNRCDSDYAIHTADRYLYEQLNNVSPLFESMIALNNICNYCENITMFGNTLVSGPILTICLLASLLLTYWLFTSSYKVLFYTPNPTQYLNLTVYSLLIISKLGVYWGKSCS